MVSRGLISYQYSKCRPGGGFQDTTAGNFLSKRSILKDDKREVNISIKYECASWENNKENNGERKRQIL